MLKAIEVANFKAFSETQRIPLRPLTLIYGANSSGKSSIIHSLILARHALETGELDIHRTVLGGESVDLGGFRQFIHRRDMNRRMEWSAELDTAKFQGPIAELLAPVKRLKVFLAVGIALDDQGRPLPDALPAVSAYEILGDGRSLIRMSKRRDGKLQLDRLDYEHPVFREVVKAIVQMSTTSETLQQSDFEGLEDAVTEIVPEVVVAVEKFLPAGLVKSDSLGSGTQFSFFPVSRGHRREDLAAAVRFFVPRKLDELIRGIGQAVVKELFSLQYLGPLRSYPPRHLAFSRHHDSNWLAGGGYAWDVVGRDSSVREMINTWLGAPDRLQTPYELVLRDLVGVDQLEGPLLTGFEWLNEEGLVIRDEIDEHQIWHTLAVVKDPEAGAAKFRDLIQSSDIEKLNELIMIDRRSNTIVSHRDVGVGVSQVLPVLVGAYASKNQIISMEQPEIHLHPALQADLGDVFIQSALGGNQNRFLIETHSEHLLLRIMRRMRESNSGRLPDNIPKVRPEDVCVLFVQPKGTSSAVRQLELDGEGELLDAWPGGFFEEGFRERFS